jgi:hypothetical protein
MLDIGNNYNWTLVQCERQELARYEATGGKVGGRFVALSKILGEGFTLAADALKPNPLRNMTIR